MTTIDVRLTDRPYSIHIEQGILARVGELVRDVAPDGRAIVVADRNVTVTHAAHAAQSLEKAGYAVAIHEIPATEADKTLETVRGIYNSMFMARLERKSPVVAVGGGITGDVAGFAAATFLRGVPLIHVPTTLLAMVDASIGGKTGVNYPIPALPGGGAGAGQATMGKNLIGAFWQPRAVIADPLVLTSLEPRDFRCGLAECVKHGIIAEGGLLAWLESHMDAIMRLDLDVLAELIERSAAVKATIVAEDERESGRRALLNLGHTFGHAIEATPGLDVRHGEAVAIGLHAAMDCAVRSGRLGRAEMERVDGVLTRLGLPIALPQAVPLPVLIRNMGYDKKVADGRLRLILPTGIGSAEIVDDVERDAISGAWQTVLPD